LHKVGLIDAPRTRMTVAQAAGCGPVVDAFDRHTLSVTPVKPSTVAKSLAIGNPADGYYSLKVIKETGGWAVRVTNTEINEGGTLAARPGGIFGGTAGGVSVGVAKKLAESGCIGADEVAVIYVTGNGLKTPEGVADRVAPPITIPATMEAFESA